MANGEAKMGPNTWLAILTAALVLITGYYAWTTRKLLEASQEMVAATKEMVETAWKTYALSVVPTIECHTLNCDMQNQPADAAKRQLISDTTIKNVGPYRARLVRVRLETDSDGDHVRRYVDRWLAPNDEERVEIPFGQSQHTKVFVHLEDIAGESHVVIADYVQIRPRGL
jgi:hypothetical protein